MAEFQFLPLQKTARGTHRPSGGRSSVKFYVECVGVQGFLMCSQVGPVRASPIGANKTRHRVSRGILYRRLGSKSRTMGYLAKKNI